MPKHAIKTYSKRAAIKPKTSSEFDFDEVAQGSNQERGVGSSFSNALPKRSVWSRTNRTLSKGTGELPRKPEPSCHENKRAKIEGKDPFAFDEEDEYVTASRGSGCNAHSRQLKSCGDLTDKSTDDEYSSSQELSESSSSSADRTRKRREEKKPTSRSPFKSFLKNNNMSLSPVKSSTTGKHSAAPSTAEFSDESQEEHMAELPAAPKPSIFKRWKSQEGKVMVKRNEKPLFTVVQNVKAVHECVESGEDQQFFDDIEYTLDGMHEKRSVATRCLSTLELASQCSQPTFRLNLRAHNVVPKIFKVLHDAPSNTCLALCTSAVTLMLTQDRLNADLDQFILELMMKLLSVNGPDEDSKKDYDKYTTKIKTMLQKQNNLLRLVDEGDINASSLARESLVSLTSQRSGAWFKEEIRILGGLDHIINAITSTVEALTPMQKFLGDQKAAGKLTKINRCLKLLESVTFQNTANQNHLVRYSKGALIPALSRLLILFVKGIMKNSPKRNSGKQQESLDGCLLNVLKVLLNITHDFESGSSMVGQQQGVLATLLLCVLQVPQFFSKSKKFDLLVLSLGLLINLLEHSRQNIESLLEIRTLPCQERQNSEGSQDSQSSTDKLPAVEALVQLFIAREKVARNTEDMTSGLSTEDESSQELRPTADGLGWVCGDDMDTTIDEGGISNAAPEKPDGKSLDEEIGEALQKAGKHMEDSVVAAYVALLMGCIVQGNKGNRELIRGLLPDGEFSILVDVLRKFLGFMKLTSGTSGQAIERIIKVLEQC